MCCPPAGYFISCCNRFWKGSADTSDYLDDAAEHVQGVFDTDVIGTSETG